MNHLKFYLGRLLGRKEWKYRIFALATLLVGVALLIQVTTVSQTYCLQAKEKTPWNDNPTVILEVPSKHTTWYQEGTPLYQYEPELTLLGFVAKVVPAGRDGWDHIYLSVIPSFENSVLRTGSYFQLLEESPSFYFLMNKTLQESEHRLFSLSLEFVSAFHKGQIPEPVREKFAQMGNPLAATAKLQTQTREHWVVISNEKQYHLKQKEGQIKVSGKMAALANMVMHSQQDNYQKLMDIFLEKLTKNGVEKQTATQIIEDPFVQEQIFHTLNVEIIQKIDLQQSLSSLPRTPEAQLLLASVDLKKVLFAASEGFLLGSKRGVEKIPQRILGDYQSKTYFGDLFRYGYGFYKLFSQANRVMEEVVTEGGLTAMEYGWGEGVDHLQQAIKAHPEASKGILKKAAGKMKLANKMGGGVRSLMNNEKLANYIRNKYSEGTLDKMKQSIADLAQDDKALALLEQTKNIVENSVVRLSSELILDKEKKGVNPAFLMFIRERLLHKREPQIVCRPKGGKKVGPGHIYQWQEHNGNVLIFGQQRSF